ncbi:hypothetical protein Pan153_10110 [Gimesia panareensis]|uniref:Uncharacterized protein n=1 Tax=Gimesia panareensis TaxID=2527978 RepID=A0A518FJ65_9PLAN|nr:hypothetical protein [Gimesia panareensis]QDV16384.1 hypothetical protein Pan153_10110 [Gimesia panareensis]
MLRTVLFLFSTFGGVFAGVSLSIFFADPICELFDVSSFEGEKGYFMILLIPVGGGIIGGLAAFLMKKIDT